jgi:hypothetical protein
MSLEIRLDNLTITAAAGGALRLDAPAGTVLSADQAALLGRLLVAASQGGEPVSGAVAAQQPVIRPMAAAVAESETSGYLPGRPRKTPLSGGAIASAQAAAVGPRRPGRPRSTAGSSAAASTKAPRGGRVVRATAPKQRTTRVVDLYDAWMADNPGPKTREQLIDLGVERGWLKGDDAKRIFAVCMNRERKLFQMMRDGNTDVYVRRAEASQPTSSPTRVVRRRGDSEVLIGQREDGAKSED